MCGMTRSHVWHDSFTCVTWLSGTRLWRKRSKAGGGACRLPLSVAPSIVLYGKSWLFIYTHICIIYICMYYMCICIICVYIYTYAYAYIYTHTNTYVYRPCRLHQSVAPGVVLYGKSWLFIYVHRYVLCICIYYMCVYVHICIYIDAHKHICISAMPTSPKCGTRCRIVW